MEASFFLAKLHPGGCAKEGRAWRRCLFHFIGHLQSNKAKLAAQIFQMIETVDRYKLAVALDKELKLLGEALISLFRSISARSLRNQGYSRTMRKGYSSNSSLYQI